MKKLGLFISVIVLSVVFMGAGCGTPSTTTTTDSALEGTKVSTLSDFYKVYKDHEMTKDQFLNQGFLREVFRINSGRTDKPDYYEFVLTSFYSDGDWDDGKDHKIFIEMSDDREGLYYYGPFVGNVKQLHEEGKKMSEDAMLTDKEEFDSFVELQ